MLQPTADELKLWNAVLAEEGLSVWEGTDHRQIYLSRLPVNYNQELETSGARRTTFKSDDTSRDSSPLKTGGAGETDNRLYLQLALTALTKRERLFLSKYIELSVEEVATEYGISCNAVHVRICKIRSKLKQVATTASKL
jgi:DNA-directed RNA polymerase specialized sigma24 family protein